jgi:hypothetical protein
MVADKSTFLPGLTTDANGHLAAPFTSSFFFLTATDFAASTCSDEANYATCYTPDTARHYGTSAGAALDEFFEINTSAFNKPNFSVK